MWSLATYGMSVALDDEWLVVGAPAVGIVCSKLGPCEGPYLRDDGRAYIFKRVGTTWFHQQTISGFSLPYNSPVNNTDLGYSVAIDGDRLAVGERKDDGDSGSDTGAVYVFKRVGDTWVFEQEISDQATGFTALAFEDWFGEEIKLDGNYLAIGAPADNGHSGHNTGAVYIFKRTGTTWALEQEISDQSSGFTALKSYDYFGRRIDLSGIGWQWGPITIMVIVAIGRVLSISLSVPGRLGL